MARGWESKSVEDQQAEAATERAQPRSRLSSEEIARQQELQGLELSRHRIEEQLLTAINPRHREMLELAFEDLKAKISQVSKEQS